jgi:FAD/FMN-containing dehydrogenase
MPAAASMPLTSAPRSAASRQNSPLPQAMSDKGAAGVRAAYGGRLARLTALKDRYDPANVFRHNANIPPSAGGPR